MTRHLASLALGLIALTSPLRADTQLLFSSFPTEYTPGTPFSFEVKFGGIPGPGSILGYTVAMNFGAFDPSQLLVEVNKPTDLSTYVLQDSNAFLLSATGIGSSSLQVTFTGSQFSLPGDPPPQAVDVVIGQNDILGVVTVTPGAGLMGPITLSLIRQETSFDNGGEAISFTVPESQAAQQGPGQAVAVPTPAGWVLLGVGFAVLAIRRA